jgi:hypothetical protein
MLQKKHIKQTIDKERKTRRKEKGKETREKKEIKYLEKCNKDGL